VIQVRVAGDDAEDSRRSISESMRLDRRRRLLAEAELSAKAALPTSHLYKIHVPPVFDLI
jgi:hypothetical protein